MKKDQGKQLKFEFIKLFEANNQSMLNQALEVVLPKDLILKKLNNKKDYKIDEKK